MKTLPILFFTAMAYIMVQGCDRSPNYEMDEDARDDGFEEVDGSIVADGCPGAGYPDWRSSDYVLPYPVGKSYGVDLSKGSGSYHSVGEPDQFAIDFAMTIGETITASRAGTVVFVEESGADGGFPNNLVIVRHNNNTYGQYMHLTRGGALVEVGQEVEPGDELGLSGATGLAGYPHLHFVVTSGGSFEYPYTSIPVTFRNTFANEHSLASGVVYPASEY